MDHERSHGTLYSLLTMPFRPWTTPGPHTDPPVPRTDRPGSPSHRAVTAMQSTIHSSRARALDFGCGSPGTPHGRSQHGPTHPTHAGEARARASTSSARPRALLCTCIHTNGGPDEGQIQQKRAGMGRVRGIWAAAHLLSHPLSAHEATRGGQHKEGRHRSTDRSMAASAAYGLLDPQSDHARVSHLEHTTRSRDP